METGYASPGPSREEIDRIPGPVLLEFGTAWCPHCQAIQPALTAALTDVPAVRHIKVEDGKGRPLGRSFAVKLWPNLVFLKDGRVMTQLARPDAAAVRAALEALVG